MTDLSDLRQAFPNASEDFIQANSQAVALGGCAWLEWLSFEKPEQRDTHAAYRQFERMLWPNGTPYGTSTGDTPGGISYGIDH